MKSLIGLKIFLTESRIGTETQSSHSKIVSKPLTRMEILT